MSLMDRPIIRRVCNAILGLAKRKIVPACIGHWSVVDGRLNRRVTQYGWRIGRVNDRDTETALGQFARERAPDSVLAKLT